MDEPIEDRPPPEEQDVDEDSEEYEDDEDEELVPTFDALNKSAATPVTIGELCQKVEDGTIDLEPEYQRGLTWKAPRQSALIDSIERGRFVPPLLFHAVPKEGGGENWVCIDGKQRLTSIKEFVDGNVACVDSRNVHWFFKSGSKKAAKRGQKVKIGIYPKPVQDAFLEKTLDATLYRGLSEADERDVFRCVQEGVPLAPGEKLQAIGGEWGRWIEDMRQKYFVGSRPDRSDGWDGRIILVPKGKGSELTAAMVRLIDDKEMGKDPNHLTIPRILGDLIEHNRSRPIPSRLKAHVTRLLDRIKGLTDIEPTVDVVMSGVQIARMTRSLPEELEPTHQAFLAPVFKPRPASSPNKDKRLKGTWMAPVELVWTIHLVDELWERDDGELLEAIEVLKKDLRKEFPREVKSNRACTAFIKEWVASCEGKQFGGKYATRTSTSPERVSPSKAGTKGKGRTTDVSEDEAELTEYTEEDEVMVAKAKKRKRGPPPGSAKKQKLAAPDEGRSSPEKVAKAKRKEKARRMVVDSDESDDERSFARPGTSSAASSSKAHRPPPPSIQRPPPPTNGWIPLSMTAPVARPAQPNGTSHPASNGLPPRRSFEVPKGKKVAFANGVPSSGASPSKSSPSGMPRPSPKQSSGQRVNGDLRGLSFTKRPAARTSDADMDLDLLFN